MLFKKQAVHDAWAATDRTLDFKITIKDKTYTATDITNLTFDSGAMNGAALTIGSTYQNTIKITFSHLIEGLELLDEVTPQIGIRLPDGTWDFTNLGVFVLDSEVVQDRNNNTTTLSASDRMCMLGGTYESRLTYPAPISDIAIEVANLSGVKINEADFVRIPNTEINSFGSVTYRDAIGYIAQFAGGFATFDRDGLLDVRTLSDPNFVISPEQYQSKGLSKNESFYRIGGITCTVTAIVKDESGNETQETKMLQAGSSSGTQITLINPSMTQVLLDELYQQLQDINFYPFALNWFGDPSLEVGDWITIKDMIGNEFKTPNLLYSLTFGGGLSAVSKADTTVTSSASFVYKGQLSQDVENIRQHMNASGNIVSEGIDPPSNPKPGDIWFAKDGPDTIIKTWVIDPETGIGSWQEQVSTKPDEKLQESVDNAVKDAADALDKSNTAVENSNKAVEDAGFANQNANEAKGSASDALNKAGQAQIDAGNALGDAKDALNKVTNMDFSSTNLLPDTQTFKSGPYKNATVLADQTYEGNAILHGTFDSSKDVGNVDPYSVKTVYPPQESEYVLTFIAWSDTDNVSILNYFFSPNTTTSAESSTGSKSTGADGTCQIKLSTTPTRYWIKWKQTVAANTKSVIIGRMNASLNPSLTKVEINITKPMLVSGNTPMAWGPSYNDINVSIANINGELLSKISQSTFDTLKGTVDSQATQLTQTQHELDLKANQSQVDTINKTVQQNTADIGVNANAIKLKADSSTVNDLTGRVTTAEGKLLIQADQIAQTVSKTELNTTLSGYATQSWTQGQIKTTADNINLSVQKVQSNLDGLEIGTNNLIPNGSFNDGLNSWKISIEPGESSDAIRLTPEDVLNGNHFIFMNGAGSTTATYVGDIVNTKSIPLEPNTDYSLRIVTRSKTTNYLSFFQEKDSTGKILNDHAFKVYQNDASKYADNIQHFTTSATASCGIFRLRVYPNDQFVAGEIILVQGNKLPKDWSPAIEDLATATEFSNLEIKVNGIQGTVANKADQSQVTQLANQITSVVGSLNSPNLIAEDDWYAGNDGEVVIASHGFYSGTHTLYRLNNTKTTEVFAYAPGKFKVKPNTKYTLKFIGFAGSNVVDMDVWVLCKSNDGTKGNNINPIARRKLSPSIAEIVTATFTTGANDNVAQLRFDNNGSTNSPTISSVFFAEVQIVEGENAGVYQIAESQVQSQITQMKDDINLRVQKGDVINQINISPESILIAGQKVHITGQTTIDNAVIKDAMIANLSASKLTAGTIDAGKINVVNLNASNITTGTITGSNLSINLNTGEILFTKGAIKSTDGSFVIDVDKKTISSFYTGTYDYGLKINQGSLGFYQHSTDKQSSSFVSMGNSVDSAMIISSKDEISIVGNDDLFSGSYDPNRPGNVGQSIHFSPRRLDLTAAPGYDQFNNTKYNYSDIDMWAWDNDNSHGAHFNLYSGKQGSIGALDYNTSISMDAEYISIGNLLANGISIDSYGNKNTISLAGLSLEKINLIANTTVSGNFLVTGSKNAVVPTRDGVRAVAAYETAETYFGDIGESNTDENCEAVIPIETLFNDTVNTADYQYQVFISKYCDADIWVSARNSTSFTVKSSKPLAKFVWEIKARRRGYENDRLVKSDMEYSELDKIHEKEVKLNG